MTAATAPKKPSAPLRFPCFITLALTTTTCSRCETRPLIYATVIDGLERHLDLLPLSAHGLAAAVTEHRWLAVVRPWGEPIAHRLNPGHWWTNTTGHRPLLLAEHIHDRPPLPHHPDLAGALLARFIDTDVATDPNEPCPF